MELGFWKLAADHPDRLAAVGPNGEALTSGQLLERANRAANALANLGVNKGDAVAMIMGNAIQTLELVLGTSQTGLFLVPINWHLTSEEIGYILEDSVTQAMVCSPELAEAAAMAADTAGIPIERRFCTVPMPGFRSWDALLAAASPEAPTARSWGSPMHYTSGTTGRPKGVRRRSIDAPPETIATSYAQFLMLFGIMPQGDGVHLAVAPLYHTAVLNFTTSSLHLGHTVVLMDKWTPQGMLERIARYRVTHSHMVPTMFIRSLNLPDDERAAADTSSLKQVIHSAAPCPVDVKHQMLAWWGPVIFEYYAATEGGGTVVRPDEWLERPGTVGAAWPGSVVQIWDDEENPLAPGEIGTVWMRMGEHTFEYHGDKKKTDKAWREGFFTVGDAGYLDEDGYLFLCDRKADMIISGGVNIYPAEIESVLYGHSAIADVAVFGVPDPDWGEQVKAVIEPREGVAASPDLAAQILDWASQRIARFKCPRSIDFVDTMPRDPNGKLAKRKLRDPYWVGTGRSI